MNIVIMGGGVIGTTTAYFLAKEGHQVRVIDRAKEVAIDGSYSNGGMLHASNTEPWNTPDALCNMFRWLGRKDSPLQLHLSQLPKLTRWGLGFLRYSSHKHHEHGTRVNTELAVYSQKLLHELEHGLGLDFDQANNGIIKIFRTQKALDHALESSKLIESLGVKFHALSQQEVIDLEPSLKEVQDELVGGIFYPDDSSGDPHLFTQQLSQAAKDLGVVFYLDEEITHIDVTGGQITALHTPKNTYTADRYIMATGAEAPNMAAKIGLKLPIYPVKGYSATFPIADDQTVPNVPIIDEERKVVLTRLGQRLRVAGIAEFAGFDRSIPMHRAQAMVKQALRNVPSYAQATDLDQGEYWACLRPMTMDGPPILGKSPISNLFLNVGPGHLGWTLAAGAAKAVADVTTEQPPAIDIQPFAYSRYA